MKSFTVKCTRYFVGEQDITVRVKAADAEEAKLKALEGDYEAAVDEGDIFTMPNENVCSGGWEVKPFSQVEEV